MLRRVSLQIEKHFIIYWHELLDESSEIYGAAPLTDGKSYAAAQAALKTNEEQFFTQEELNKMLPAHLRKNE